LRTNLLVGALLTCVHLGMNASAQAVQGAKPTLAETMAFLNDKFQQRGTVQITRSDIVGSDEDQIVSSEVFSGAGCEQIYLAKIAENFFPSSQLTEQRTRIAILRLDKADLSSIAILEPDTTRTAFSVAINKIAFSEQISPHWREPKDFDLHSNAINSSSGPVISVDAASVTWLPEGSGTPRRSTPDNTTRFFMDTVLKDGRHPKATFADISPGDYIEVIKNRSSPGIYIKKLPGASAPSQPDPEFILPATRQVGSERKQFVFGYTKDRDDAEHLAKAMIHAIVLCQANAMKELF
jgi:hypothetical protein